MKYRTILITLLLAFFSIALVQKSYLQTEPETQPIKTIMQRLMMDMHTITLGIWTENYETIYSGAHNIVAHPKILKEQREEIAGILGNQMKSFVAIDKVVHHHADSIAMAAKVKNMQKILYHYEIVQNSCVNCHSTFRTQIIKGR
jgi:cytochrome c556